MGIALLLAFLPLPVALTATLFQDSTPASTPPSPPPEMPASPPVEMARKELAALKVEAPHSLEGYHRDKFEQADYERRPDIRDVVLHRDGTDVGPATQRQKDTRVWFSPYDERILTEASEVYVDHLVPLANAWHSGAHKWNAAQRHKFANDLSTNQLISVSTVANSAKGDQSPDQWVPPNTDYHCPYAKAWTHVKFTHGLSVTKGEKAALEKMLNTCR